MSFGSLLDRMNECLVTDSQLCSAVRHKKSECRACIDVCTEDAILITSSGGRVIVDSSRCSGCGKCVAVCPCTVFSLKAVERAATYEKMRNMINETGELVFACSECPESDAIRLRSLAFVDKRLMIKAVAAGTVKITLFHDNCADCRKDCLKIFETELDICREIFETAGVRISVEIKKFFKPKNHRLSAGPAMNRREFFGFLKTGAKKKAGEMLLSFADDSGTQKTVFASDKNTPAASYVSDIKVLGGDELIIKLQEKGLANSVTLDKGKCTRCGVCVRLCAFGVFTDVKENQKGIETITDIITDSQKCTGCGVCLLSCAPGAIEIIANRRIETARLDF